VYVGGETAIFDDFASVIAGTLPLFLAVVIGLGFILLLIAFRSVLIPLLRRSRRLLPVGLGL
jgi:RND superfamily putative drug exporter